MKDKTLTDMAKMAGQWIDLFSACDEALVHDGLVKARVTSISPDGKSARISLLPAVPGESDHAAEPPA